MVKLLQAGTMFQILSLFIQRYIDLTVFHRDSLFRRGGSDGFDK